jgi:hypothetical protein
MDYRKQHRGELKRGPRGIDTVREVMHAQGKRGNPKDHVVLAGHRWIQDFDRSYEVQVTIPEKLEPDNHVFVFGPNGRLEVARVVRDEGPHVWVTRGRGEVRLGRGELYPTAIPRRPTAVHKKDLWLYVGESHAQHFWRKRIGRVLKRATGRA